MCTGITEKKRSVSGNDLCMNKVEPTTEKIFTSALLVPLALVAGMVALIKYMGDCLWAEAMASGTYVDPFKSVWWSGPISFSFLYLAMIFIGQRVMKDREEMKIKPYIFTYNLYQCVLNLWGVVAMIYEVYSNPHFLAPWGNGPQTTAAGFRISFLVWVHYNNKFVEMLDTVWMVLRKKNKQVSFLHCYHHLLLCWAWFFVCKVETGGDVYFGGCVNSFIHVVMYGYYTLALLNVPCPWKKMITNLQMLQFTVVLMHSVYVCFNKHLPIELPLVQGFVMINMLVLFGQFYYKSYIKKPEKKVQ
jgi:elongation of very long chain fatty acids protein 4